MKVILMNFLLYLLVALFSHFFYASSFPLSLGNVYVCWPARGGEKEQKGLPGCVGFPYPPTYIHHMHSLLTYLTLLRLLNGILTPTFYFTAFLVFFSSNYFVHLSFFVLYSLFSSFLQLALCTGLKVLEFGFASVGCRAFLARN